MLPAQPSRPADESATRLESDEQQGEARQFLMQILERVDTLAQLSDEGYFDVESESSLGLDDQVLRPLRMSSSAQMGIVSALDHLRTVAIVVRAGSLPYVALFSLLRSAIETSSVAIYLLEMDSRVVRAQRLLAAEYQEIRDRENSQSSLGQPPIDREAAEKLLQAALRGYPAAWSWVDVTKSRTSITTKVTAASAQVEGFKRAGRNATAIAGLWQLFSGVTHARSYAVQTVLDREEVGFDPETGVVDIHFTTGVRSLTGSLLITLDVVETAIHMYGKRAREFTNQPEDTDLIRELRTENSRNP